MSAWGTGSFENEDAQKWLIQLKTLGVNDLRKIFASADQMEYIEAPQARTVVAAAEVVATLKGSSAPGLAREIEEWCNKTRDTPGSTNDAARTLSAQARHAVNRVRLESELKDLWLEADGLNEWSSVLRDLEERLAD